MQAGLGRVTWTEAIKSTGGSEGHNLIIQEGNRSRSRGHGIRWTKDCARLRSSCVLPVRCRLTGRWAPSWIYSQRTSCPTHVLSLLGSKTGSSNFHICNNVTHLSLLSLQSHRRHLLVLTPASPFSYRRYPSQAGLPSSTTHAWAYLGSLPTIPAHTRTCCLHLTAPVLTLLDTHCLGSITKTPNRLQIWLLHHTSDPSTCCPLLLPGSR